MSTRTRSTKSAPAHTTVVAASASAVPAPTASHATAHTTAPAGPVPPTSPAPAALFIPPPPPTAVIPSPPAGFVATTGASYRGTQPHTTELVALPLALRDLRSFTGYATAMGMTAPPVAEVIDLFDVTNQWSTMRNAASAWDLYCRDQEGIAWAGMRTVMGRLKPAFMLAARANPSLLTTYAGLASLLGAKVLSAHKAVATKKRNKLEVAAGKAPTHGQVGKTRQKAAARAALAAQNARPALPPPIAPVTAPVVTPVTAPAVAGTAPAIGGASGATGAAHS